MLLLAGLAVLFIKLDQDRKKLARRILGPSAAEIPAGTALRRNLRRICALAALFFLISAACVPQWGIELAPVTEMRGSLIVAVDVSYSMAAKDLKPNRLEHARMLLNDLAERLAEYRVGIVAFAGKAYTQCPLTDDAEAIKYFASQLTPGMLPFQGTDFTSALEQTLAMTETLNGTKVLVLITDGEDHSKNIDMALKEAQEADLRIFPVGLGSPEGELVPLTDSMGNTLGYKKDRSGKPVISRLDENLLMKMAAATGAAYVRYAAPDSAADALVNSINRLSLEKTKGKARASFKNRYQWPLSLSFLFLMIELLLMDKRIFSGFSLKNMAKGQKMSCAAVIFLLNLMILSPAYAESAKSAARDGNTHYRAGEYEQAAEKYEQAARLAPDDYRIRYNLGVALYKKGEYEKAKEIFDSLKLPEDRKDPEGQPYDDPGEEDKERGRKKMMEKPGHQMPGEQTPDFTGKPIPRGGLAVKNLFNSGNARYKAGDAAGAIEEWKQVLKADPMNENAKFNLQKAIAEKQPPQCQNPKQDPKNNDKDDKDKNKNQGGDDKSRDGNEKKDDNKNPGKNKDDDKQNKGESSEKEKQEQQKKQQDRQKQKEREQAEQLLQMMAEKEKSDADKKQAELRKMNAKQQKFQVEEDW